MDDRNGKENRKNCLLVAKGDMQLLVFVNCIEMTDGFISQIDIGDDGRRYITD